MPVSVCIATYNGEKFIHDQLASILGQLSGEDEVVISDDSSSDQTLEIIRAFNDPRIRIIEGQRFRKPYLNFENALKHARNEYIFLSDQDDLWADGKVSAMVDALKDYDMVICDHSVIDENNKVLMRSYFEQVPSRPGILHNLKKNTYYGCCMAFRKVVLTKALPFPKDVGSHDIWLGFVAGIYFRSKFISYPYTLYRKHGNNASTATDIKSDHSIFKKLEFRYRILKHFPWLILRNLLK